MLRLGIAGLVAGLLFALSCQPPPGHAEGVIRTGVREISLVVSDLDRETAFFTKVLGLSETGVTELAGAPFPELWALPSASARVRHLHAGEQNVSLVRFGSPGRVVPPDSRSNDGWFQHLAIVVSDIDRAAALLRKHGVTPISQGGPQTIPLTNPAAGGIRAYYFRDPENHPLELIWYPAGKGNPRWQARPGALVLGIDHTAIAIRDDQRSETFYREVAGLEVKGRSYNVGVEQEQLSGVTGARVRITGLGGQDGPGVEFLRYEAPLDGRTMPDDTHANDLWSSEITLRVPAVKLAVAAARKLSGEQAQIREAVVDGRAVARLRDPDGHALKLVEP